MTDRPLRASPAGDYEQMIRLATFRQANPAVVIGDLGFRVWQARIPRTDGTDGEVVLSAHVLADLLDKLDELGRLGELPAV